MTKAGVAKVSPVEDEQKYRTPHPDHEAVEQEICNPHTFFPFPRVLGGIQPRIPSFE